MAVKLFVTDMDGTLLVTGKDVSSENVKAVQKAVAAGITVTIATGRMYAAALPTARQLKVDVPIITYNGALIKSVEGEILYSSYIAPRLAVEIINFCKDKGWLLQGYSDDELYIPEKNQYSDNYEVTQKVKAHLVGWDGLLEHVGNTPKILLFGSDADETEERLGILREHFGDSVSAMRSNANYGEITNPNVNKAEAIKWMAKRLGISIDETMAIGDSSNDLAMLKAAGKGIAMGNAIPEVKEAADYITDTCENHGFAKAIYKYALV